MTDIGVLDGYVDRAELARQMRCSERTISRYENQPDGLPSVVIAGRKFYSVASVKGWLTKREQRPNRRRVA